MHTYELRYYRNQTLYKCAIPASSLEEAIKKLQLQSPEINDNDIADIRVLVRRNTL